MITTIHTCGSGGYPSAICDGRKVTCLGCGAERCHAEGVVDGRCRGCLYGLLPGWSGCDRPCGYKGCSNPAAFGGVPGAVKSVCLACSARPKVPRYTQVWARATKITLREAIIARAPHSPRALEWLAPPVTISHSEEPSL